MKRFALLLFISISSVAFAGTYEEELNRLSSDLGDGLQKASIKTVAVVNFKDLQGKETDLCKLLAEELPVNLVNQKHGIYVVDRSNLDRIMSEQKLTEEGLINPINSKKLKLAGIDAIIYGTIVPFENAYRINIKSINTETATMVAAVRGSIVQTDSVDSMMGIKKIAPVPLTVPGGEGKPFPIGPSDDARKNKKIYDLGGVTIEILKVDLLTKSKRVRVDYSVSTKTTKSDRPRTFYYRLNTEGTDASSRDAFHDTTLYEAVGHAADKEGNDYKVMTRTRRNWGITIHPNVPISNQIEYQYISSENNVAMLPNSISFWFEFYIENDGFYRKPDLCRLHVIDYAFDTVQ